MSSDHRATPRRANMHAGRWSRPPGHRVRVVIAVAMISSVATTALVGRPQPAAADVTNVVFNTDVTVAGREETVWVTADGPGAVSLAIDFNQDGVLEPSEEVVTDQPVVTGDNRVVYNVPTGDAFVPGLGALTRIVADPGGVIDTTRDLFDAEAEALALCPDGTVPIPVSIIANPSFESRTANFANTSAANTINFAEDWFDAHTTGGQYLYFDPPTFDSGPGPGTMPVRAGADGQAFLGGHTGNVAGNSAGEGATNTLMVPLDAESTYVGFFAMVAGGYSRGGDGYMDFFGVNDPNVGSFPQAGVVPHDAENSELLYQTQPVEFAGAGVRPVWEQQTFSLDPTENWPYLRVEVRNVNPAQNGSVAGQAWINFDDFQMYECSARVLEIAKTSTATADSRPGDTVDYTIVATNVGAVDFTTDVPAVVIDDLSGVLDDASYNADAAASVGPSPTFSSPRLTWSGPLAAGDSVTITYSVTLTGGGDGVVENMAFQSHCLPGTSGCPTPDTPTTCEGGFDPDTGMPCGDVEFHLPRLTIVKSATHTDLPANGEDVTYTVTITNIGPGDYTATAPATMTDDLTDVLDDATGPADITATVGTATFTEPTLSWSGVLAAGQTAVITYTVTYDAGGDQQLVNLACVPPAEALDPAVACVRVTIPGSGLVQTKFADPTSGTAVEAGDTITYTLAFTNTGNVAATIDTTDDLVGVLDDATLTTGPNADAGLTATLNGDIIEIAGSVPVNQTLMVTYTVTVRPFAEQGDHVLANALACQPGDPDPCLPQVTTHPVRHATLTKTSDAGAGLDTGDVVTYTLTITNDGAGDYTALAPAQVTDDLTGVLDDAQYNDDADASIGTVAYVAPLLSWSGPLTSGDSALVTYSVTVTSAGDHTLTNTAQVSGCADDPSCEPQVVDTPVPRIVPAKQSDPVSGTTLQAGATVSYTLTFTNVGEADGPVTASDDLTDVLDDADITGEPVSSLASVTAVLTDSTIVITGTLDAGAAVTVTYQVTIRADGQRANDFARNLLVQERPPVSCDPDGCTPEPPLTTTHPIDTAPPTTPPATTPPATTPPATTSPPTTTEPPGVSPPTPDPPEAPPSATVAPETTTPTSPTTTIPTGFLPATGGSAANQLWLVMVLIAAGGSLVSASGRRRRS